MATDEERQNKDRLDALTKRLLELGRELRAISREIEALVDTARTSR
jgi:hypothetical protein